MSNIVEEKIEEIRSNISDTALDEMVRPFHLADAILEGSAVSDQAFAWGDGANACALSAAVMSAKARGYL